MALSKLFRALPPRKANPEELMESYLIACHKCTRHAVETVVVKLIRGEIDGVSKSFAPSCAELSSAIRSEMDWVAKQAALAEQRMQIEDNRAIAVPAKLIEQRRAEAKAKMEAEGRRFLFETESHVGMLSRRKECPVGSIFNGILCAAYGPPGSINQPVKQPAPTPEHADVEF